MYPQKKEPVKIKICCACGKEKELEKSFYRNKLLKDGWESRCKLCKWDKKKCRKMTGEKRKPASDVLTLQGATLEDYCSTYSFLQTIGYSLESDIHLQFCEKYGLEPKKRVEKSKNRYSPSDCK